MLRRLGIGLLVLAALGGMLAAVAWWAARSEAGFAAIVARLEGISGGRLRVESPRGTLLGPFGAARVVYTSESMRVTATGVELDLHLDALLKEQLEASALRAKELRIEILPAPSTGPPDSLAAPLPISVERFDLASVVFDSGGKSIELRDVAGAYHGGAQGHRVELARLRSPWGDASGLATLGASKPFALDGRVHFVRTQLPWRVDAGAELAGTLLSLKLRLDVRLGTAPIQGDIVLAPFEQRWLVQAQANARGVNLADFYPDAPGTDATIKLQAASAERAGFTGDIAFDNTLPGTPAAGRVPLKSATSRFAFDGSTLRLSDLAADLGAAGRARGSGEVDAGGASHWRLTVDALNLRGLHAPLRETRLAGTLVARLGAQAQQLDVDLREKGMSITASAARAGDLVRILKLRATLGQSELAGEGSISLAAAKGFEARAKFSRFDPAQFGDWPEATLNGAFTATGALEPAWRADVRFALEHSRLRGVELAAHGTFAASPSSVRNADVSATLGMNRILVKGSYGQLGDALTLDIDAPRLAQLDARAQGQLAGQLTVGGSARTPAIAFNLHGTKLRWAGAPSIDTLAAKGELVVGAQRPTEPAGHGTFAVSPQGVRDVEASATLGANRVHAKGSYGQPGDTLTLDIDAPRLAQFDARAQGQLAGQVTLGGSARKPEIAFDLRGTKLRWADAPPAETLAAKGGLAAGAQRPIEIALTAEGVDALARFEVEWDGARGLRGVIARLENRGEYAFALAAPAPLAIEPGRVVLGAAKLRARAGELALERLAWENGRVSTSGRFHALPAAPLLAAAGWKPGAGTDLTLRGEWSLDMNPRMNGTVRIERESGDIVAAASPPIALGLRRFAGEASVVDDAVRASANLEAASIGSATLQASAGGFARDAPLAGRVTAEVKSLRPLDELAGTSAIIDGRAALDLTLAGTLGAPAFAGGVRAEAIRIDVPQYGIALREGQLRASLKGESLVLEQLSIRGPEGELSASGTLTRGAEGAKLDWRAQRLRIFNRPDRRLVVTGSGTAGVSQTKLALRGELRAEEGYVEFGAEDRGRLGEDVVIVGRAAPAKRTAARAPALDLDITLDPGQRFRIVGQGLDANLRGKLHVQSRADGAIVARGTIETAAGSFRAFGQKLEIERGRLIFDGPIENPALDVLALRRHLQVEAGVEVSGTVRAPQVKLASRPLVPDAQKLSWLVLGRETPDAAGTDFALLQAAASMLVSSDSPVPVQRRIIQGIGLDDIAVHGAANNASGQVVAFGKRFSDRVYVEYEQGVGVAANLVRLTLALTRTLSVNAEAGQTTSSLGFTYRRSYE